VAVGSEHSIGGMRLLKGYWTRFLETHRVPWIRWAGEGADQKKKKKKGGRRNAKKESMGA